MPWSLAIPQPVFASPILSVGLPITTGSLVGYLVNRRGTKDKYYALRQPPLYPPPWLFAPVWTTLYGMMGYAAHHAFTTASPAVDDLTTTGQTLYTTQLVLNNIWMPLFFGMRRPALALADILLLGGNVAALMGVWWKTDKTAFWLMAPYAAWLGYATYLNASLGVLNDWTIGKKKE
ncbi:hypothetical protein ASPWEDRAFT_46504 [Aspergillus wentii DTO 134E9]|uniref:TspO/MBR-related protein n=1 Tax=Aspergillus wentii DTO 134E9 TaxID=1073089 RepID=A0A1L9R4B2_ASPWE|nr:uncharacterized protein ASPWEDRAFT_46504 [Aspergillus wentii DTO 134E9]KAI9927039.1 hypothetical protein MW887_003420 [Aspergillus wentii]OJJ29756.1 hypothetical protein ASPWEDRAFT_46504 [Aspergillus wentii DTO 134E9]